MEMNVAFISALRNNDESSKPGSDFRLRVSYLQFSPQSTKQGWICRQSKPELIPDNSPEENGGNDHNDDE